MQIAEILVAQEHHVTGILDIYGKIVSNSHTSFEYDVPGKKEMWERIRIILKEYPYLVYVKNNEVLGYAYASRLRGRKAYEWSAEVSVYVAAHAFRQGIGRQLYASLLQQLKSQNIHNLYAGIALPNETSIQFHENFGFEYLGTYSKIGFKLGKWIDVSWYQMRINESESPSPFIPWNHRLTLR